MSNTRSIEDRLDDIGQDHHHEDNAMVSSAGKLAAGLAMAISEDRASLALKFYKSLVNSMPKTYFRTQNLLRSPIAPVGHLLKGYFFEVISSAVAFAVMAWYFASISTRQVTISVTTIQGQNCTVLNPKKGTVYYSNLHSENGQFASPVMSKETCLSFLKKNRVCDNDVRRDHLTVLGVTNPNNSQYYTGLGRYFSFTPSQTAGATAVLSAVYGKSIAFPQPLVGQTFTGSESTWYQFNFAEKPINAFSSYAGMSVPSLLTDPVTNNVYGVVESTTCSPVATTSQSSTVQVPAACISSISMGDTVKGSGIPPSTTVAGILQPDPSASQAEVTLSNAATATSASVLLTFSPTVSAMNLDFSSAQQVATMDDKIGQLRASLGLSGYGITDIGVFDGVYYGIRTSQIKFDNPYGVAVLEQGSAPSGNGRFKVYVADRGTTATGGLLTRIEMDIGTKSQSTNSGAFNGIAVDGSGVLFTTDGSGVYKTTNLDGGINCLSSSSCSSIGGPTYSIPTGIAVDGTLPLGSSATHVFYSNKDPGVQGVYKAGVGVGPATKIGVAVVTDTVTVPLSALTITASTSAIAAKIAAGYIVSTSGTTVGTVVSVSGTIVTIDTPTPALTSASVTFTPQAFYMPSGLALDSSKNVYVADMNNHLIRKIDANTDLVTSLGTKAIPSFLFPEGVAVDSNAEYLVVADTGNNLVRKIDLATGTVTTLGASANPGFNAPKAVAIDSDGNIYIADTMNNMVRVLDPSTGELSTRVGVFNQPKVFSFDTKGTEGWSPTSIQLNLIWDDSGGQVLSRASGSLDTIAPIDSTGGCQSLEFYYKAPDQQGAVPKCFTKVHSEYNAQSKYIYVEFLHFMYKNTRFVIDSTRILILKTLSQESVTHFKIDKPISGLGTRQLWGVFQTSFGSGSDRIVLFTSRGAYADTPSNALGVTINAFSTFNALVTATGTTVLDGSVIPDRPRSKYLLLLLSLKGSNAMATYDTSTDTYILNSGAAATTNYMLAYTYGVCDGAVASDLVEISFSNDFSTQCPLPKSGLYYQSKNVYYTIPYECLGIAHEKLLTDCAVIKANMKILVDETCSASMEKMCTSQFTDNPPFACSVDIPTAPLTVISLSGSNTMAISGIISALVAIVYMQFFKGYKSESWEMLLVNNKNSTVEVGHQLKNNNSGGGKDINAQILTIASEEDQNQTELLQMQAKVDVLTRRLESLEKQFRAGNSKVLAEA